ncbi:hypothetical protein HPB47_020874 [Ixodes persulcatus]|uniref:Uncharacterized protein n=1 Tax=Ixodes persulcatus TaxID=34615 RepID=A0AC60QG88_IXOPE|nr:hypothetical protein HPB47_020874 [Ixodes persulcatus]
MAAYTDTASLDGPVTLKAAAVAISALQISATKQLLEGASTKGGELTAIRLALLTVLALPDPITTNLRIFTDSQEAVKECRIRNSPSQTVRSIKKLASQLVSRGTTTRIVWVPGHAGIPGHEQVHRLARASLILPRGSDDIPASQHDHGYGLARDRAQAYWEPQEYDPGEVRAKIREDYLAKLEEKLPENPDPLPCTGFGRRARVLLTQVQCGKFSVISVLPNITNSRMFCMIYFEKFKELPETPEESEYVKMVNFTAQNGCKKLHSINLKGKLALIRDSADCSLDQVVLNFKAAQAYGIVIASSRYKIENLIAEKNDSSRTDIVVGFVTDGTAEHILALMRPKEPLIVKFYQLWASKKQAEKGTAEKAGQGPPLAEMAGRGPPPTPDDFYEEEVALNISPGIVVLFVCLMGGMLVVLYLFFKYLVYFLIGMFALGAIVSTIVVFEPLIYRLPIGTTRIPQKYIPCFNGPLEIRQLALIVVSASLAIFWVVIRHQSYSWMLQNFFGVMFGINLLKSLRMPSLMPMLSESEDAPAPSAGKTSQPEEDEGPRLVHGNERLFREPYVQQQPYAYGPHGQALYGPDARSQMWRPT